MNWLASNQHWFAVTGLILDIVGFGLLCLEWQRAMKLARRDFEKDLNWFVDASMDGPSPDEFRQRMSEYRADTIGRARYFWIGAALIILGFVAQLIGSWPLQR